VSQRCPATPVTVRRLQRKEGKDWVACYSTADWELLQRFLADTQDAVDLCWSPNGSYLAVWESNLGHKVRAGGGGGGAPAALPWTPAPSAPLACACPAGTCHAPSAAPASSLQAVRATPPVRDAPLPPRPPPPLLHRWRCSSSRGPRR